MTARATVVAMVLVVTGSFGNTACDRSTLQPSSPPKPTVSASERPQSWVARGVSLLQAGRCADLRALLKTVPPSQISEQWYELRGLGEAMCWSHSRRDADKRPALSAIEEGMQRYPNSASLIADKGGLLEMFGDVAGAQPFYERAAQVATANLRRKPQSQNDRDVLRRLGKPQPPESAAPSQAMTTPSAATDLADARPAWQQRTWQLIAADDCKSAIEYLKANPLSDTVWYAMYSQADLLCWQDGFGDDYKQHGLAILDVGLHSHRDSPRLLKSKTEYYEFVGDKANAARFRQMASESAKKIIVIGDSAAKDEGEEVLNELRLGGSKQ